MISRRNFLNHTIAYSTLVLLPSWKAPKDVDVHLRKIRNELKSNSEYLGYKLSERELDALFNPVGTVEHSFHNNKSTYKYYNAQGKCLKITNFRGDLTWSIY